MLLATSVDVEQLFSKGHILLLHLRNGLSANSIRASLCLGDWSKHGLVKDEDVLLVTEKDDKSEAEDEDEGSESL